MALSLEGRGRTEPTKKVADPEGTIRIFNFRNFFRGWDHVPSPSEIANPGRPMSFGE